MFRKSFWLSWKYTKKTICICISLKKTKNKISWKQIRRLVDLKFVKTCDELFPRCKFPLLRLRPFSYIRSGSISQRCLHRLPSIKKVWKSLKCKVINEGGVLNVAFRSYTTRPKKFFNCFVLHILCFDIKLTHKWQFYNHLRWFLCKCMFIFHKTEVQTVILRCWTSLNLDWFKSYGLRPQAACEFF